MIPTGKIKNSWVDYDHGHARIVIEGVTQIEDTQFEKETRKFAIDACEGSVLIAGLGLGLIIEELATKPEVTKITVVEKAEVCKKLVWKHLNKRSKCRIVIKDVKDYLKTTTTKFDYIYLDCFLGPEDDEYRKQLRILAEKHVSPDRVLIWQEKE